MQAPTSSAVNSSGFKVPSTMSRAFSKNERGMAPSTGVAGFTGQIGELGQAVDGGRGRAPGQDQQDGDEISDLFAQWGVLHI